MPDLLFLKKSKQKTLMPSKANLKDLIKTRKDTFTKTDIFTFLAVLLPCNR